MSEDFGKILHDVYKQEAGKTALNEFVQAVKNNKLLATLKAAKDIEDLIVAHPDSESIDGQLWQGLARDISEGRPENVKNMESILAELENTSI